ncbi:MAG: NERD domain-containing protein [Armatimonadetes bacterium]|nr:NERD domain-containing protein [Armatimonadota bacterium]
MKTIQIYVGSPIEIESEKLFLAKLQSDLQERKESAIIFANFMVPPRKPRAQIDFLIVTSYAVCHVELKAYHGPLFGTPNGPWSAREPDGSLQALDSKNPYRQALDAKQAISDAMHCLAKQGAAPPPPKNRFYKCFNSVVCIEPELHPQSQVVSDYKVSTLGYKQFLSFLLNSKLNPGWDFECWRTFAVHLGLVRIDDQEPDHRIQSAQEAIKTYSQRFSDLYGNGLADLVPVSLQRNGSNTTFADIVAFPTAREHAQIIGPSGCGKSHLLLHMALNALQNEVIPVLAYAKHYEGKLSYLLDRSVASLLPERAITLFSYLGAINKQVVFLLDGFNECPERLRGMLCADLQAFYLRWSIPIIITSQEKTVLSGPLSCTAFTFQDLSAEEKTALFRTHSGREPPPNIENLLKPFPTAYAVSIASNCLSKLGVTPSLAELLEEYARLHCERLPNPPIAWHLLIAFAQSLHDELAQSLPLCKTWDLFERKLAAKQSSLDMVQEVLACELLDTHNGSASFRHELLQRFFEARFLLNQYPEFEQLAQELARPRCHPVAPLVIGMLTTREPVQLCLQSVPNRAFFSDCLSGHNGPIAQEVLRNHASRLLREAEEALPDISLRLRNADKPLNGFNLEFCGQPDYSPYDFAALAMVGDALPGEFLTETLQLIAATDRRCEALVVDLCGSLNPTVHAYTIGSLYKVQSPGSPPAASVVLHFVFRIGRKRSSAKAAVLESIWQTLEEPTPGQLLLLTELVRMAPESTHLVAELLQACWETGLYHVQLEGLYLASDSPRRLCAADRKAVTDVLFQLKPEHLFLSTTYCEALAAYDLLEPPVDQSEIDSELRAILHEPDSVNQQEHANTVVGRIFEDVFQGAYYTAIDKLSAPQKVRLYTMAVLGAPDYGMFRDWTLRRLIELEDPDATPAFLRAAQYPPADCNSPQSTTASFLYGFVGCAMHLLTPPDLGAPPSVALEAWRLYGEIVFWLHKPALTDKDKRAHCESLWLRLKGDLAFEAVDPLCQFVRAGMGQPGEPQPVKALFESFPDELRQILEFGLRNQHRIVTLWKQPENRLRIIISLLGTVGSLDTLPLLNPFIDDDTLGHEAIRAIGEIKQRKRSRPWLDHRP